MFETIKKRNLLKNLFSIVMISITTIILTVEANAFTIRGLRAVNYAKQFLGRPYVYGATGPNSFDCSGLTSYTYRNSLGIDIGRTTYDQIKSGVEVSQNQLQPGDLVFPNSGHVSIYIGDGKIIHAPQTGDVVKISPIYKFWRARRIIGINSSIEDITFDPIFYSYCYGDLSKAFGTNEVALGNHFLNNGKKEGRCASPVFDTSYYLNNNSDLKAVFGNDYLSAYNHFLNNGYKENRALSPVFNMGYYLNNNPDVRQAFGTDYLRVLKHFIEDGMREGRKGSAEFNLNVYKNSNPDLVNIFGNNNEAYYNHYIANGMKEGRKAK